MLPDKVLEIEKLGKLIRYFIIKSTTAAGSGHLTSSLSAVELMTVLFFCYLRCDLDDFDNPANDRVIFSKGHASPLLYSLYAATDRIKESDLQKLRKIESPLEGHPSKRFEFTEVPTGSLGQGLSVGVGIALNNKYLDKSPGRVFVLLGDGEIAEGQVWEAVEIGRHYLLDNLYAVVDVNKFGQSDPTMSGWDLTDIDNKFKGFGWNTYVVDDGHDIEKVSAAYDFVINNHQTNSPSVIIAKTIKGKGVDLIENKVQWHGKVLDKDQLDSALFSLGDVDTSIRGTINIPNESSKPTGIKNSKKKVKIKFSYKMDDLVATRQAYGDSLLALGEKTKDVVVLDGDMKNSTYAQEFSEKFKDRYFEMYIAEQNMISVALGLATRGKVPFVSTFAAFLTRAFDQIRMANMSGEKMVITGSHVGVSIGEDGPSQMGLEDISMFRTLPNTVILYPSDAVSTTALVEQAYLQPGGMTYLRITRPKTPIIYAGDDIFEIGGSKTIKSSASDRATIVCAGVTAHEALKAHQLLAERGISVRVIDAYCLQPIDEKALLAAAEETGNIVTVEDHYEDGGLGDAVAEVIVNTNAQLVKLALKDVPRSGDWHELLAKYRIDSAAIVYEVEKLLSGR